MRYAIIDLGTNTFNLLVIEINSSPSYTILHRNKITVILGEGGIQSKTILPDAYQRGMKALDIYFQTIQNYKADKIFAFATSALRNANNGGNFTAEVKRKYGIDIALIAGVKEAEYIYKGINLSLNLSTEKVLIIDIGGGSNEYIIADGSKIYWKQSIETGIARIVEHYSPSDPIHSTEISGIKDHFKLDLQPLKKAVRKYEPKILIGASGSFNTIAKILDIQDTEKTFHTIPLDKFNRLYDLLLASTKTERKKITGIEEWQIPFIVPAVILIKTTLELTNITHLIQSYYSLKEGVLADLLDGKVQKS